MYYRCSCLPYFGLQWSRAIMRDSAGQSIAAASSHRRGGGTSKASVIRVGKLRGLIIYPKFGYAKGLFGLWCSTSRLPPVIYNPITRKVRPLPRLNFFDEITDCYYSLGFEPDKSKYKILLVRHSCLPLRYWVYTLGTSKSWREIKSTVDFFPLLKGGVCINGAIYNFGFYNKRFCIVEFNLRTEIFRIVPWWKDLQYDPEGWFYYLIELEGKLAVVDRSTKGEMDLWILERSKSSEEWVKHAIAFPSELSDSLRSCFCSSTPDG
nr:putative F-box protein At1g47730 [Nicotiana tomentosiformis]